MSRVAGVLLAAGSGRRFGSNKLLVPLADGTALCVVVARKLISVLPSCVAVVRPGDDELATLLRAEGLGIVECAQAGQGMGHSLAAGVAAVNAHAWLIALADMPYIKNSTLTDLIALLAKGAAIVAPYHQDQRGHPVGFTARYGPQLRALTGDNGARNLLVEHAAMITRLEVDDPGILLDIDTPADLHGEKNFCPRIITS